MRLRVARTFVLPIALALFGCSGAIVNDDQQGQSGQGKDRWEAEFHPDGTPAKIVADFGRDKDSVALNFTHPVLGSLTYSASGVTGAQVAAFRSQVEIELAKIQGDVTPEIVSSIIDAALRASGIGAAGGLAGALAQPVTTSE